MQYQYTPETGDFIRLWKSQHAHRINVPLGLGKKRSGKVNIDGAERELTHWIWLYQTGKFPEGVIDHIDGNQLNNRWNNLREVTQKENMNNKHMAQTNNKLGILGVDKLGNRFRARIKVESTQKTIGIFDTPEEAKQAYLAYRSQYHPVIGVR